MTAMVTRKKKKLNFQVISNKQGSWHKDLLSLGKTVILMPGSLSFIKGRFPDFLSSSLISKMFFAQTFPWTRPLSSWWTEMHLLYIYKKKLPLKRYFKKISTSQHEGNKTMIIDKAHQISELSPVPLKVNSL